MSIKTWAKERNWARLTELRHFTLSNLMFFVAFFALFVVLFNFAGGWGVTGMDTIVSAWAARIFLGLSVTMLLILLVLSLKWLFSKRTDIEQKTVGEINKSISDHMRKLRKKGH